MQYKGIKSILYIKNDYFKDILLVNVQHTLSVILILILIKILYNITSDKMYNSSLNNGSVEKITSF
jgi:hypothetical protein